MLTPMLRRDVSSDPFEGMRREIQRFFGPSDIEGWAGDTAETAVSYPCDLTETDEGYEIEAELPGFARDQVEVTLHGDVLTIRARREARTPAPPPAKEGKGGRPEDATPAEPHLRERRFTRVQRSFRLPGVTDHSEVEAELKEGVLHLKVAKAEPATPHRIRIR